MEPLIVNGWLPDPPGAKDPLFEGVRERFKPSFTGDVLLPTPTPVSRQGNIHSCTANAAADALEMLMARSGLPVVQLSRLFIYYNARNLHGSTGEDGGTYLRMTFEAVKRLGVCPETMWDYVPENVNVRPSLRAYHAASDNKVTAFYRITSLGEDRLGDIEAALRAGHPVAFGTHVTEEFKRYDGAIDRAFPLPSTLGGRHAMLLCGVRRRGGRREFRVRNSWGATWGMGGYAWMDEGYVMWPRTSDIWVPTMMPELA
jgi:hypothetical protein